MIAKIRNSFLSRILSILFAFLIGFPVPARALTGGPSQPEFTTFTPVEASDMVDLFSGDFQYNIPLLDVEGYPINLSYATGMGMEDQASCVGFGWTLNAAGTINRMVRGIPDDFAGDEIVSVTNMKPNWTIGVGRGSSVELVGLDAKNSAKKLGRLSFDQNTSVHYNSYTGLGYETSYGVSVSSLIAGSGLKLGASTKLGLSSESGLGVDGGLSASISGNFGKENGTSSYGGSLGISGNIGANSRAGLRQASINSSFELNASQIRKSKDGGFKKHNFAVGYSTGSSIPVGFITYIPQRTNSMQSFLVSTDFSIGPEFKWGSVLGRVSGYFTRQSLVSPVKNTQAYGYLYLHEGSKNKGAQLDFNREKDGPYNENIPSLPLAQMTYDIYTASGQGVSGMFRPFRDFGTVYDPHIKSESNSGSFGGDVAFGDIIKVGVNGSHTFSSSSNGRWSDDGANHSSQQLSFNSPTAANPAYEAVYFKNAGEFSVIDRDYYEKIQEVDPVRMDIDKAGTAFATYKRRMPFAGEYESPSSSSISESSCSSTQGNLRQAREPRTQTFSFLTAQQAKQSGLPVTIYEELEDNSGEKYEKVELVADDINNAVRKDRHIAEITVNRPDGFRYIYGSQTYNYTQQEVTFNVENGKYDDNDKRTRDKKNGYIAYDKDVDNSTGNEKGVDHYYNSNELPAHATAYQLTAILSPDYVDVTGNGPSPDDLGNYTQFSYIRLYDKGKPYKWRNPYTLSKDEDGKEVAIANFNEGFLCKENDNKGTYIYGEKEIKMLHSIETKNYTAKFHYSNRLDAWDIAGKNGGLGNNALQKLDSIQLFSRHDLKANKDKAIPVKTVHFSYNYSLCKGILSYSVDGRTPFDHKNNTSPDKGGKLTLKSVSFTYGKSKKGMLSPYIFTYDTSKEGNPEYNPRGTDRWGTYKDPSVNPNALTNIEMPYTAQNEITNQYASAWCLKTIQLPSGGAINVEYESDDYTYVESKRATSMVQVLGFGNNENDINNLAGLSDFKKELYTKNDDNNIIFFNASGLEEDDFFEAKTVGEKKNRINKNDNPRMEYLFYKFCIDLGDMKNKKNYEYISGYVDIKNAIVGFKVLDDGTKVGWIGLTDVEMRMLSLGRFSTPNPVAHEAMQFVRVNIPELFFGGNRDDNTNELQTLLDKMLGNLNDMIKIAKGGIENTMRSQGFGKNVDTGKSFIRLMAPNYKKLGGGVRVKKLTIDDDWHKMSGETANSFSYGQTYEYTKTLTESEDGIPAGAVISSGVASYEPAIGGEENALHNSPDYYTEEYSLAPDNRFFIDRPYGESLMPSPTVGYSKVTVKNLQAGAGYSEHEFYTVKDFPVLIREPYLIKEKESTGFLGRLLNINVKDNLTASQSYSIELNDMHGKPKATRIYGEEAVKDKGGEKTAISEIEYFYRTDANYTNRLSNYITAIRKDGKVERDVLAGINIDMTIDEREDKNFTSSKGIKGNFDGSSLGFIPFLPIPSVWMSSNKESTRFRSITNTKVVTRYGILDRIVAKDLGAKTETQNLAWDAETGQVLLTKTQNDFKDPVYSFTYPAHWGYDGMAGAYKNLGIEYSITDINGRIPNAKNYFAPGDEIFVYGFKFNGIMPKVTSERGWVTEVSDQGITALDKNGTKINVISAKIIRSGRRNQPMTPIGNVISLHNPIEGNELEFKDVLSSSAIEFGSDWSGFCQGCELAKSKNPYLTGQKGTYRPKKTYAYLTGRTQSDYNRNTNTRVDGTFTDYAPFRVPNKNFDWIMIPDEKWTSAVEVTLFSPYGFELENMDALGRYSSAIYGYNNTLPVAVAGNAQYKETGVAGFEEEDEMIQCEEAEHFFFGEGNNEQAHTGKKSIKITPEVGKVTMTKILIQCDNENKEKPKNKIK